MKTVYMPIAKGVLLMVVCSCLSAQDRLSRQEALYTQHRWLELRQSVDAGTALNFYQGAVDAAFNRPQHAERELKAAIQEEANSHHAHEAHELLHYMYMREGRYADALAEDDALLKENPRDSDARDDRQIFAAFSQYGNQSISGPRYFRTTIRNGELSVPLKVNGVAARFALDSGANLSLISESEAKRFGLVLHDVSGQLGDSTGGQTRFRVAIAERLSLGQAQLKNVAFLVVSDKQQPFKDLPPGEKGLIGLPVILAFSTLRWSPNGALEMGFASPRLTRSRGPNLCFEGAQPIVEARLSGRALYVALDTGAEKTVLWPHFLHDFSAVAQRGRKRSVHKSGVARSLDLDALVIPRLTFQIGGLATHLAPAEVLLSMSGGASDWFDGNLGLDVLNRARTVTVDFNSMLITLQ